MSRPGAVNKQKSRMEENKENIGWIQCDEEGCKRKFPKEQNLTAHKRRFHKTERCLCPVPGCNKSFKQSWDLETHIRAHNGEEIKCEYCGKSYSKKSNLFNHRNRGNGCPKQPKEPNSTILKKETERNKLKMLEEKIKKIKKMQEEIEYVEVKQETDEESDKEPGDLVIDDRDQSEIMDTNANEIKTEPAEDQDKEPEKQKEMYCVRVQEPRGSNFQSQRLQSTPSSPSGPMSGVDMLLKAAYMQEESSEEPHLGQMNGIESNSTPSPPASSPKLLMLANLSTKPSRYSNSSRERSMGRPLSNPEEVQRVTPPPLNLTSTTQASDIKPKSLTSLPTTYRDIRPKPVTRPANPPPSQPFKRLQPAAGQTNNNKRVPGQTIIRPVTLAPAIRIQDNVGHVPLTNGGPGHVPHVSSGLIQMAQTIQVNRFPPGGASLLRTNVSSQSPPIKTEPVKIGKASNIDWTDIDQEIDTRSDLSSGQSVMCPTCGRVCSTKASLARHITEVHSDNITLLTSGRKKTLRCYICHKMFGSSSNLAEHKKNVHEGNKRVYKRVECNLCGKEFARTSNLNQHFTQAHAAVLRK